MTRIDWTAVAFAVGGGLALIVVGAALSAPVADRYGDWVAWAFLAVVVAGFGLSGALAGQRRQDTPVLHGALAAALTFVGALLVGLVVASLTDRSVSVTAIPVGAVLAVTCGVAGALAVDALHRRWRRIANSE